MSVKTWHILDNDECMSLLDARHLGRIGFVDNDVPTILPINYTLVDGAVVFRTNAGGKLNAAIRGAGLAFEIDGFDALDQTGWSVLVRGVAEVVSAEAELTRLQDLPLLSWAPGLKPIYVRIGAAVITGQRIDAAGLPSHWWG